MAQSPPPPPATSRATRGDAFMKVVRWLTERGVSLLGSRVLTVRGRKTGNPQSVPVNLLTLDGERFLVAPRGNTQWVRNVRAAGMKAQLRVGRRVETVRLVEVRPTTGYRCFASTSSGGAGRSAGSSRASPPTPPTPSCGGRAGHAGLPAAAPGRDDRGGMTTRGSASPADPGA